MKFEAMTIQEIKEWLFTKSELTVQSSIQKLAQDPRKGVQQLLKRWYLQEQKKARLKERWELINREEKRLRTKGLIHIAGIDEVGRGPLAGPVVSAAVILPEDFLQLGIDDSKKLSVSEREELAKIIKKESIAYSISSIDAAQIDQINIYQATLKSMVQAVEMLSVRPQFLLIDALYLPVQIPQKAIVKGDSQSVSIAAASILAKVHRDQMMVELARDFPEYGFDRNKGYGTKEHLEALRTYGASPIHRRSFLRQINSETGQAYEESAQ